MKRDQVTKVKFGPMNSWKDRHGYYIGAEVGEMACNLRGPWFEFRHLWPLV